MAPATTSGFVSKTQHYLKVKKPLLERQRRARINKCLDALKTLIAEFQNDDAILRMDKAEMLETAIEFIRSMSEQGALTTATATAPSAPVMDCFRNGYMNAVNEVSRVMAGMSGMSVDIGKSVMTHLGFEFNRMLRCDSNNINLQTDLSKPTTTMKAPLSPASSGYHSDDDDNSVTSPIIEIKQQQQQQQRESLWRPW